MKNKNILIGLGILGAIAIPLVMAKKPPEEPQIEPEEGWYWNIARWNVNKWF